MFEKKFVRPRLCFVRSERLSDVKLVCEDGVANAHQFVLERHSPFLKKFFVSQSALVGVTLNHPRVMGLPSTLKERREPSSMVQIHLPNYTLLTVNLLLDLLYTGKTSQLGDLDESMGQLNIRLLYKDLGMDPEFGGLPDIAELDTVEMERVKKTSKTANINEIIVEDVKEVPLIEAATSTTVDLEESPAVNNSEVVGLSRGHVETLAVSDSENTLQETEVDTVDVNDLLSDEEIELEDDYETSKIRNEAFDTTDSKVQENTKHLKEFSKIKLGTKEHKEKQSDQGVKAIQSYDWELEMLDTSVEFEKVEKEKISGVTSKGRRRSVNLVKKSQLQLAENEYEHSRGDEMKNDHKSMKDQAKLAVFRDKKRKYPTNTSSLTPLELRKAETVKTRRFYSAEHDQEDLSIESNMEIINSTKEKNEIKSTESIANCFKKLCSAKLEEVDFSITAVSTNLINSKEEPSAPITPNNKNAKINKPTSLSNANKKRKTEHMEHHIADEFVCPIQGCSFKHIMNYSSSMKRIYRILKHLVSHHLRKKPCKIYEDLDGMFCSNKELTCSSCTYTSKSKTSLLTHMAYEHGDLFKRLKKFQKKARTKEEIDIYLSIDDYLKKIWENWRARVPSSYSTTPKCSVNLTVKDCNPCDEMYPNWNELRTHVLTKHCLDKLDLYISGSKEEGYECEATYCTFKVKDKIDILNHLASKDHSIISDKEIVDIALGVHRVNGLNSTCKDSTGSDSIKPISVNTDESLDRASRIYKTGESSNMLRSCKKQIVGVKMDRKENDIDMVCDDIKPESVESEAEVVVLKSFRDIKDGVEMVAPKLSPEEQVARKRKFRNESFELFGPPLQILKDQPVNVNKSLHKSNFPSGSIEMETLSVEVAAEVTSGNEERATLGNENIRTKKYQCKFCVYNYVSDDNLREHVLSEHRNKFKTIPLLEGGQKFYECDFCSKRTKVRSFHLKHLKSQHKVLPLELVESVEEWKTGILSFLDFCSPQDDDSFGYLSQHSSKESNVEDSSSSKLQARLDKSPVRSPENKNIVHVPAELNEEDAPTELNADDAVIETINDFIFKLDNESKEISQEISGTEIPVTHNDEAKHDNNIKDVNSIDECSDDEVIEEFVSITKRKPLKPKLRQKMPTEFVCQVCDKIFSSGAKVSAHVFMIHLQRMSDNVWQELYRESEGTSGNICLICEEMHERRTHAKLHQYSNHKRELKKKMEEKGQDWRNLLDYIQYKVTADMINEEDLTESSEVESRHGSIPEVYNNPFYLECTSPVITNSIPSCQTSIPVNQKHDKEAKKELPPNTVAQVESNVVETKESTEDERKESTENETKEPEVNNVMVRNIQDVSDSDDGVQVMTSRNDHSKKLSEVDSKAENGKVKDIEVPESLHLKPKLPCPFPKCDVMFPDLPGLVDHYLETHPQSPLKLPIISSLAPERIKRKGDMVTVSISGEDKVLLPCQHCEAQFTELSLLTRHVNRHKDSAAVQCDHCRNFVKVEEKQQHQLVCLHKGELEKIRILKAPLSPLATPRMKLHHCTHKQVGCAEVFTEKKDLHDHARKCRFRPKTNFSCQHTGCKKRYYYKADYDRHLAKFHATTSGPATTV